MPRSNPLYYKRFIRCARCSHNFEYENPLYHPITLPICGHTMCRQCIGIICNQTKCSQDKISFGINNTPVDQLPINYSLLIILFDPSKLPEDNEERYGQCPSYMKLDNETKSYFNSTGKLFDEISLEIKPIINDQGFQSIFSYSMIRKIFSLLNSQYIDLVGRSKVLKAVRRLGEHICIDFIRHHQNPQQLTDDFRSAIGLRNGEFLEPAMQEKVLESILLFLEGRPALSYKNFVHSVLFNVSGNDPDGMKTNVKLIADLLSDASCFNFKIDQDGNSSLYPGFYLSSQQWSLLLYGNIVHEVLFEQMIDKYSTAKSFNILIEKLVKILPAAEQFEYLSNTNEESND